MKVIYKYPIEITESQFIQAKPGPIIHVGLDLDGIPCLWIQVWSTTPDISRVIYVIGTGNPMPSDAKHHLGSFLQGPFVWHVYE